MRELRHTARRPLRLFVTLLLTLGQTALAVYLCIVSTFPLGQKAGMMALSLTISAMQVFRLSMHKKRARYVFAQLRESGELPDVYFLPHTLTLEPHFLKVIYGEAGFTAELELISSVIAHEDMFLLFAGKKMLEIVPLSALPEGFTPAALLSALRPDTAIRVSAGRATIQRRRNKKQ